MNHSISREIPISLNIIVCESIPEVSLEKPRLRIDKNKIFLPVWTLKRCVSVFFPDYHIKKFAFFSVLQLLQPSACRVRLFPPSVEGDRIGT